MINVVTIAVAGLICGYDNFVAIAAFGREKKKWLRPFLDLSDGNPSHDRSNALLGAIEPAESNRCGPRSDGRQGGGD